MCPQYIRESYFLFSQYSMTGGNIVGIFLKHTIAFVTPVMEHWLEWEIAQWVHHEGSIRRPIAPWANALTTELHLALLTPQVDTISCGWGIWTEWSNLQHGKRVDKENESAITPRSTDSQVLITSRPCWSVACGKASRCHHKSDDEMGCKHQQDDRRGSTIPLWVPVRPRRYTGLPGLISIL